MSPRKAIQVQKALDTMAGLHRQKLEETKTNHEFLAEVKRRQACERFEVRRSVVLRRRGDDPNAEQNSISKQDQHRVSRAGFVDLQQYQDVMAVRLRDESSEKTRLHEGRCHRRRNRKLNIGGGSIKSGPKIPHTTLPLDTLSDTTTKENTSEVRLH